MHTLFLVTCTCLWAQTLLTGAAKPNFSGNWKLNLAKSDFGKTPTPDSMITRIQHREPEIRVHSEVSGSQGSYASDYTWRTDGRENVNTVRGNEICSKVTWNGRSVVSDAKTTVNGVALRVVDQWTLSEDGRVFTVHRNMSAPQGNAEQTYVYEK